MNKRSQKMGAGGGGAPKAPAAAAASRPQDLQQKQERQEQEQQQRGLTEWKALLCTLIADRELKPLRYDAKRLLRRLCVTQVRRPFRGFAPCLRGGEGQGARARRSYFCAWLCSALILLPLLGATAF